MQDTLKKMNQYTGISQFYDLIMTAGYYDYDGFAQTLVDLFGERRDILELGIGTGLVCEKLLAIQPELELTGLDYTDEMVKIAKQRLGESVKIRQEDVVQMTPDHQFESAFSVGGVWYFIHDGDKITFCSHIFDKEANIQALKNIQSSLQPGGQFLFAVQGVHTNYEKLLPQDYIYAQTIEPLEDNCFIKDYFIKKDGNVLAEQRCHYRLFTHEQAMDMLKACGFEFQHITENKLFHVYKKAD